MSNELLHFVESTTLAEPQITAMTREIHDAVLRESQYMDAGNFSSVHPADLKAFFTRYDRDFFDGQIQQAMGETPLRFRLSKRMTSSGGTTALRIDRRDGSRRYEITISTALLFGCFRDDDHRSITASGITCHDRIDALQRVMEHEITHVLELMLWDKSSCARRRFQEISLRFFAHTDYTHRLITPREKAMAKYGIRPGMTVRFRLDGAERTGVVNRVNKRATVLVEEHGGVRYTDGKRYAKYYVPPKLLKIVDGT